MSDTAPAGQEFPDALTVDRHLLLLKTVVERDRAMAEVESLRAAAGRVRALCADRQAEAVGGGLTDVDTLWPSEVLRALDGEEA